MAELFYTILTNTGKAKWAAAIAQGTTVNLEEIALGSGLNDAYYNPTESQLTLKTEVWRGQLSSLSVDSENPNWIILEGVVLATDGGFSVREVGIFDAAGDMIAIGKFPETYKPSYADGSTKDLWVKVYLEVSNTSVVTLAIDPAVAVPTVQTVNNAVAVHNAVAASESTAGHVQMATQAETTAGVVTNKAVVPATLKAVTDTKQPLDATLTALAALATAADKIIYATGSDTFGTATLTAFARTLLDDADAATARATLGISPAVDRCAGVWASAGTFTWTVPAGVYSINAIATGGGGGGGGKGGGYENGGGGAGGTSIYYNVGVTPGATVTITVGAGGVGGNGGWGGSGGTTTIQSGAVLGQAYGGSGGGPLDLYGGVGGIGGGAAYGQLLLSGQAGMAGFNAGAGLSSIGGTGGASYWGGGGIGGNSSGGLAGSGIYGSGGGGSQDSGAGGGAGGVGVVVITY